MAYPIEVKLASRNGWYTPAESRANYSAGYDREGITLHWWNTPALAGTHDQTVNYILGTAEAGKLSVNYVLSDAKITMMVSPENVAWASNGGNPTTISIECQPTLGDEGYKRLGWLIAELERKFGRTLSIYGHNRWTATACPGSISLQRARAEANNAKIIQEVEMITTREQAIVMYKLLRPNGHPTEGEITGTVNRRSFAGFCQDAGIELQQRDARLAAQGANIQELHNTIAQLHELIRTAEVTNATSLADYQAKLADKVAELSTAEARMAELQAKVCVIPDVVGEAPVTVDEPLPEKTPLLVRVLAILLGRKSA